MYTVGSPGVLRTYNTYIESVFRTFQRGSQTVYMHSNNILYVGILPYFHITFRNSNLPSCPSETGKSKSGKTTVYCREAPRGRE